jgi:hypothetical protein
MASKHTIDNILNKDTQIHIFKVAGTVVSLRC